MQVHPVRTPYLEETLRVLGPGSGESSDCTLHPRPRHVSLYLPWTRAGELHASRGPVWGRYTGSPVSQTERPEGKQSYDCYNYSTPQPRVRNRKPQPRRDVSSRTGLTSFPFKSLRFETGSPPFRKVFSSMKTSLVQESDGSCYESKSIVWWQK